MSFIEGTPTVVVQLDKPRTLGFTNAVLERLQQLGAGEMDFKDAISNVRLIPMLIWSCLSFEEREELSVERVKDMVHPRNTQQLSEAIAELWSASFPEELVSEGKVEPAAPKVKRAAGRRSTTTDSGRLLSTT